MSFSGIVTQNTAAISKWAVFLNHQIRHFFKNPLKKGTILQTERVVNSILITILLFWSSSKKHKTFLMRTPNWRIFLLRSDRVCHTRLTICSHAMCFIHCVVRQGFVLFPLSYPLLTHAGLDNNESFIALLITSQ